MPVDWEARHSPLSRSRTARPARRDPDDVQRKHIFEAMAAKGYATTWSEAKILVRDNPELNVPRRKIDPLRGDRPDPPLRRRRRPGPSVPDRRDGPARGGPPMSRADYIDRLIEAGLDGIEAQLHLRQDHLQGHAHARGDRGARSARDYRHALRFISGGSDYHADHKKGAKQVRSLGRARAEPGAVSRPSSAPIRENLAAHSMIDLDNTGQAGAGQG